MTDFEFFDRVVGHGAICIMHGEQATALELRRWARERGHDVRQTSYDTGSLGLICTGPERQWSISLVWRPDVPALEVLP